MESIHTIETPDLTAKLNKAEIDILHFIDSWLPTFSTWSVEEISHKCSLFRSDADDAIDMLILHGLLDNADACPVIGRRVSVPEIAALWMRENTETIYSIKLMLDTDLYDDTEIAES
jgi:RIO-like serine/threonine protein kinase